MIEVRKVVGLFTNGNEKVLLKLYRISLQESPGIHGNKMLILGLGEELLNRLY
jgi:hypothetical protein